MTFCRVNGALLLAAFGMSVAVQTSTVFAGEKEPAVAYKLYCSGCHMDDGMGAKLGQIPPIPGIAGHLLRHDKGRLYVVHVPGVVNAALPSDETARLLNYMFSTWATNDLPPDWAPFTGEEVERLRAEKVHDITELRRLIAADLMKQGIDISY